MYLIDEDGNLIVQRTTTPNTVILERSSTLGQYKLVKMINIKQKDKKVEDFGAHGFEAANKGK